jgi:hypothetical protein
MAENEHYSHLAVQFHPEKAKYECNKPNVSDDRKIPKNADAIALTSAFSKAFVEV